MKKGVLLHAVMKNFYMLVFAFVAHKQINETKQSFPFFAFLLFSDRSNPGTDKRGPTKFGGNK